MKLNKQKLFIAITKLTSQLVDNKFVGNIYISYYDSFISVCFFNNPLGFYFNFNSNLLLRVAFNNLRNFVKNNKY